MIYDFYYFLLPLLAFAANLALVPFMLWRNRKSPLHQIFALFLLAMALWGLTIYGMRSRASLEEAYPWELVVFITLAAVSALFYHFTVRFARIQHQPWVLPTIYLTILLLSSLVLQDQVPGVRVVTAMQQKFYGYAPVLGLTFIPYALYCYGLVALGLWNLGRSYQTARTGVERNRSAYLMAGAGFSLLGTVTDVLPVFGLFFYPLGIVGNLLFSVTCALAILRYRLLDIAVIVRKGVSYSVLIALVLLAYVGIILTANRLLYSFFPSLLVDIASILVLAIALQPLLSRVQRLVDRWFYGERYDPLQALQRFSSETKDIIDLDRLSKTLVQRIASAMQAEWVALFLPSWQEEGSFVLASCVGLEGYSGPLLQDQQPLLKWLEQRDRLVLSRELQALPEWHSLSHQERETLEGMAVEIFVPLVSLGQRTGLLFLGTKRLRQPYSQEDLYLLQTAAAQAATSLESARLLAQAQALAQQAGRSELRYRNLLAKASDGVFVLEAATGKIQEANEQACVLSGYALPELSGRSLAELYLPREGPQLHKLLEGVRSGRAMSKAELHLAQARGRSVPVEASFSLVGSEEEAVILAIVRDITERVRVQEEFRRAHEAVVQANRDLEQAMQQLQTTQQQLLQAEKMAALGRLVSGVAHELNNPLTGVIGYSQLLLESSDLPPVVRADVKRIGEEAQRASRIVRNLLSFARRHQPEKRLIDVTAVLARVLELRNYELRVNNINVVTRYARQLPRTMADEHQLEQVFLNIINNAEDAMLEAHGRGTLLLQVEQHQGRLRMAISDDGPGIPPEHLAMVFDPFFTTKPTGKGTGLGLSICYGIIQGHGGTISVTSQLGRGATFVVELPIVQGEESPSQRPAQPVPQKRPKGGHLLLVDDEPSFLELLSRALRARGHHVDTLDNGKGALKRIQEGAYDLLIADLKMPDLGGLELYETVRQLRPLGCPRAIFVSGDTLTEETRRAVASTGCPFRDKPVALPEFLELVERCLKEKQDANTG